jgi:hypothetical protein
VVDNGNSLVGLILTAAGPRFFLEVYWSIAFSNSESGAELESAPNRTPEER